MSTDRFFNICADAGSRLKLRITNYELRITNYELRITNYFLCFFGYSQ
ncbi:malonyl CoA-acyl carrier protein transacylase [Pseudanabaena sp. lw0831]|nr:malonyl CoA-acyl carrier protein transacylase [Pseudanabaena sp. lw0831]